ncbi:MAG: hypothetical protein IJV01_00315 [Bacteroidales bacterium]|nr:hypothetical protein [Bacteroidales bacterium]
MLPVLRARVEKRFGREVRVFSDFSDLAEDILQRTGSPLSESFLKRFWGYIPSLATPRASSLDILCRYSGIPSFAAFCHNGSSNFISASHIDVGELSPGDRVEVGWAPDRSITLRCLGGNCFEVERAQNAKIKPGAQCEATHFFLGAPLMLTNIVCDGETIPAYVAGMEGGITALQLAQ